MTTKEKPNRLIKRSFVSIVTEVRKENNGNKNNDSKMTKSFSLQTEVVPINEIAFCYNAFHESILPLTSG